MKKPISFLEVFYYLCYAFYMHDVEKEEYIKSCYAREKVVGENFIELLWKATLELVRKPAE